MSTNEATSITKLLPNMELGGIQNVFPIFNKYFIVKDYT